MPVPSSISDLSTTPALNSPPGSESPSSIDDYLRTLSAFIRQINDLAATKADDSAVVKLTGAQTVAGTKTFSASPVAPNPTAGTRSQALATMQMFADEFGASLGGSGWQKLPSGLIIQWGGASTAPDGVAAVTFPVAFPNACLATYSNYTTTGAFTYGGATAVGGMTKTGCQFYLGSLSNAPVNGAALVWLAIGH